MAKAIRIEQLNNLRVVVMSDGRRVLMLPTGGQLWISGAVPPSGPQKTVINSLDFLTGQDSVVWATYINGTIVIGCSMHVGGFKIFHSDDLGHTWAASTIEYSGGGSLIPKIVSGVFFTLGSALMRSSDNGHSFQFTNLGVSGSAVFDIASTGIKTVALQVSAGVVKMLIADSPEGLFESTTPIYNHSAGFSSDNIQGTISYSGGKWFGLSRFHTHFANSSHTIFLENVPIAPNDIVFWESDDAINWNEGYANVGADTGFDFYTGQAPTFDINGVAITQPNFFNNFDQIAFTDTVKAEHVGYIDGEDATVADTVAHWLNDVNGSYWYAINRPAPETPSSTFYGTELLITPTLDLFSAIPIFRENDKHTSAKCDDGAGNLYVFEKDIFGDPDNFKTRLVKVTDNA